MAVANVITTDSLGSATSALFYQPSQQMHQYIASGVNQYIQQVGSVIPMYAESIRQKYDEIVSSSAVQYISVLKNRLNSVWQTNSIRYLNDIDQLQQAPSVMRRWIMAQPDIRQMYQNNAISGYGERYEDKHPDQLGYQHYDYRRVMNGVVYKDNDLLQSTQYYEHVDEKDLLNIVEKSSILSTWDYLSHVIDSDTNRDPTSPWNGLR